MKSELKRIRTAANLTQPVCATYAGVSLALLGRLEKGGVENMQLHKILQVALSLGVSASDLLPGLAMRPKRPVRFDDDAKKRFGKTTARNFLRGGDR